MVHIKLKNYLMQQIKKKKQSHGTNQIKKKQSHGTNQLKESCYCINKV